MIEEGYLLKNLPANLDGLFRELAGKNILIKKPNEILYEGGNISNFKRDALELMARDNIKVIYGDVVVGIRDVFTRLQAGVLIGASGILYEALEARLDNFKGTKPDKKTVSRRELLQNTLLGIGAVVAVPSVFEALFGAGIRLGMNIEQQNAGQRIFLRLNGLTQHLKPEDHLIFLRNLVMADKMMTVAEQFYKEKGKKPRIAFNVGALHAGIEDFLIAGHNLTRWLIEQYPNDVLTEIVKYNGGSLEEFCTARILTLPSDLRPYFVPNTGMLSYELNEAVIDERVIDQPLLDTLKEKLAVEEQLAKEEFSHRREQDISELRGIFKKHLSEEIYPQMDDFLDSLRLLSRMDYERVVAVYRDSFEVGKRLKTTYNIAIPDSFSPFNIRNTADIRIDIIDFNEQRTHERLGFFLDENQKLSKTPDNVSDMVFSLEELKTTIRSIFPHSPEDEKEYILTNLDINGKAIKGYLQTKPPTDDTEYPRYRYSISQDGYCETTFEYAPYLPDKMREKF